MKKEKLIQYLNEKYEALEFWESLRNVVPSEDKIALLKQEIDIAYKKLLKVRGETKYARRLSA